MRPTDLLPAVLTRRPGSVRPDPRPDHDTTEDASLPPALARRSHPSRPREPREEPREPQRGPREPRHDARKDALLAS
jgi:hypothetical protein